MAYSKWVEVFLFFGFLGIICSTGQHDLSGNQTANASQFVEITQPKEKDDLSSPTWVKGNSSAIKGSGLSAWILTYLVEIDGPWRVQPTTTFPDGSWQSYAEIPESGTYRIIAIITNVSLEPGHEMSVLPELSLSSRSHEVIATRN